MTAERVRVWVLCLGFGLFLPLSVLARQSPHAIFVAMAVFAIIATAFAKPRDLIPAKAPMVAFLAIAIYVVVTHILMPECDDCLKLAARMLPMLGLIVWVVTSNLVRIAPKDAAKAGWCLCAGLLVAVVVVLIELNNEAIIYSTLTGKQSDTDLSLGHRYNRSASALILLAWPLAGWLWWRGWRTGALAIIALVFIVAFNSFSLSAVVSGLLGIAAGTAALIAPTTTFWAMIVPTAIFWAISPWFLIWFYDWTVPLFSSIPGSAMARIQIWDRTAEAVSNAPFFGHGIRAIQRLTPSPSSPRHLSHGMPDYGATQYTHPHNVPIQIWLELGVVGVILFAALAATLLWPSAKALRTTPPNERSAVMAALAATILTFLVSFGLWYGAWLAMIAMMVLAFRMLAPHAPLPGEIAPASRASSPARSGG